MKNRLSKILAEAGVASRRSCEKIIFAGRVTVNGKKILLPEERVDSAKDKICVDGEMILAAEKKVYYLLNKPPGYVCSNLRKYKRIILDLFEDVPYRLFTVGRLDKETSGLLLVTNDGQFANRVIHPSSNLTKEYVAKTNKEIGDKHLRTIAEGTTVDNTHIVPVRVNKVRKGTIKICVKEGKKHEVRLLLASAGLKVLELKRTRIGGLSMGKLPVGQWRILTEKERQSLFV